MELPPSHCSAIEIIKARKLEVGYISKGNTSLIVVQTCPIFIEPGHPIFKQLQAFVVQLLNPLKEHGRVTILKNHHGQLILSFEFGANFKLCIITFQTLLQHLPYLAGITVQTPKESIILGNPYCEEEIEGLTFRFSSQNFIQNHPEQSLNIYRQICQLTSQNPQQYVLDLYCGFGITSLLLAKQGHFVSGIEINANAIRFAKENAILNGLGNVHFIQGNVKNVLPYWLKNHQANCILVNPPRRGLDKEVIEMLLKALPESLIYVSCMPTTLARDLNVLCEKYYLQEGKIYDMFPQTAHVENARLFEKKEVVVLPLLKELLKAKRKMATSTFTSNLKK